MKHCLSCLIYYVNHGLSLPQTQRKGRNSTGLGGGRVWNNFVIFKNLSSAITYVVLDVPT